MVGSTGPGSGFHIMATLLRNMFGAKLKTIAGYESGPHLLNAVEKEETQGTCGIAMASIGVSHPHWLRDKLINLLIQTGLERDPRPELAGVPMAYEMAKTAEQKAVMDIVFANGQMDRPVLAPPGVPAARVAALRAALKATLEDRDFLAETAEIAGADHLCAGRGGAGDARARLCLAAVGAEGGREPSCSSRRPAPDLRHGEERERDIRIAQVRATFGERSVERV